jgi:hypothetical protein
MTASLPAPGTAAGVPERTTSGSQNEVHTPVQRIVPPASWSEL